MIVNKGLKAIQEEESKIFKNGFGTNRYSYWKSIIF
jgi:hypothetical protein